MPQVDLSSVCGGGAIAPDRKVACETIAPDGDSDDPPPPAPALDYAPESFCLSKDAELEWLDQNAYIERKNSGKASNSTTPNPNPNSIYGTNRQSANVKSKASFFGLPKPRKPNYAEAKNRRTTKPASIRLFPKRSESVGRKPVAALSEPSSPKVSCMGRVRSRKKQSGPDLSNKKNKTGFWTSFRSIFRSGGDKTGCKGTGPDGEPVVPVSKKSLDARKNCGGELSPSEPPGLGVANRFTSGRRSDGWASEIEMKSEALDQSPIWRRRE